MAEELNLSVKRINKFQGEGATRAFCDVAVGESFLMKGFKVVEGKKGLFVGLPGEIGKDGKWYDNVTALTEAAKEEVGRVVLEAYQQEAGSANHMSMPLA